MVRVQRNPQTDRSVAAGKSSIVIWQPGREGGYERGATASSVSNVLGKECDPTPERMEWCGPLEGKKIRTLGRGIRERSTAAQRLAVW